MNTRISYLYRDASNYKKHNEVVVPGTFTPEQIKAITGCLDAGGGIVMQNEPHNNRHLPYLQQRVRGGESPDAG